MNDKGDLLNGMSTLADFRRKKFKCPKGHKWEAWGNSEAHLNFGYEELETGPVCPHCVAEFFNTNFPAERDTDE